jgi:hypothetical protein
MSKRILVLVIALVVLLLGVGIWVWADQQTQEQEQAGGECGGIAGLKCPPYYVCYYPENAPADAVGQCIPEYVDPSQATNTAP